VCHALKRHRDVMQALRGLDLQKRFARGSPALVISIDPYIKWLRQHFDVTVLIKQPHVAGTVYGDICHPPFKPGSFRLVIQSHVMEHVKNDLRATRMIKRLLKPGGLYVSNVPCGAGPRTIEFGAPDPAQHGHWRLYGGEDYMKLLTAAGLQNVRQAAGKTFIAER